MANRTSQPYVGPFFDAAWYLCRIGVLRPGPAAPSGGLLGGATGDGYTVTEHGKTWLASHKDRPPADPSRLAQILQPFGAGFGPGYLQRTEEASACYRTMNYLACCAMAGAAAESILLAVAIAKTGDEDKMLKTYRAAGGRRDLTRLVAASVAPTVATRFQA